MFKKGSDKMARANEADSAVGNTITAGTTITGDINTNGNIRVDGTIQGSVNAKGKVVVGQTGKIEGEVFCQNADISGTLKAKVTVGELLALKSTANLLGEIITNKLSIEPGANFSGNCSMGAVVKEMSHGAQSEKELATEQTRTA
ncbi:MAG: polymer-forming cytoskeletal protein [Flavobacteriales bacterium]|nr:polymer-forming cytoskeletal protein [Flavobacteriales bacterium]